MQPYIWFFSFWMPLSAMGLSFHIWIRRPHDNAVTCVKTRIRIDVTLLKWYTFYLHRSRPARSSVTEQKRRPRCLPCCPLKCEKLSCPRNLHRSWIAKFMQRCCRERIPNGLPNMLLPLSCYFKDYEIFALSPVPCIRQTFGCIHSWGNDPLTLFRHSIVYICTILE